MAGHATASSAMQYFALPCNATSLNPAPLLIVFTLGSNSRFVHDIVRRCFFNDDVFLKHDARWRDLLPSLGGIVLGTAQACLGYVLA